MVPSTRTFVRGRLVPLRRGRFGTELRFSELPGARLGNPFGVTAAVKRLRLFIWAERSAKVRARGGSVNRVRFHLLHNPYPLFGILAV